MNMGHLGMMTLTLRAVCIFEREKCSKVIMDLFNLYNNNLNLLPCDWQKKIKYSKSETPKRIIGDYISGMTDRFAINQNKVLVN